MCKKLLNFYLIAKALNFDCIFHLYLKNMHVMWKWNRCFELYWTCICYHVNLPITSSAGYQSKINIFQNGLNFIQYFVQCSCCHMVIGFWRICHNSLRCALIALLLRIIWHGNIFCNPSFKYIFLIILFRQLVK